MQNPTVQNEVKEEEKMKTVAGHISQRNSRNAFVPLYGSSRLGLLAANDLLMDKKFPAIPTVGPPIYGATGASSVVTASWRPMVPKTLFYWFRMRVSIEHARK